MCSTAVDDALTALEAALDEVTAEQCPADDASRLHRARRLTLAANRITALQAAAVRDAEVHQSAEHDGLKTMGSWLRSHTRLSGAAVNGLLREGRAMALLPAVEAAFLAGAIGADQVDAIAEIVKPDNLERARVQDVDLDAIEQTLLQVALGQPYSRLCSAVGHYLARLDPDGREPDPTEQRSLTLVQHPDGSVTGGLALDQHGGETVMTALEAAAAKSRCAGDTRTRDQRLADAFVQICANYLATGEAPTLRNTPAQLLVLVNAETLTDPTPDPAAATSGTGAALSSSNVRRIACDSQVNRIVFGPGGVTLDLGRTQRLVTPSQRKVLDARDGTCVFAGCTAPNWWCEVALPRSGGHPHSGSPPRERCRRGQGVLAGVQGSDRHFASARRSNVHRDRARIRVVGHIGGQLGACG